MSCRWTHPQRPRGSQSGREKRRDESFQVRAKEPLGTDSHRTISKNSSGCPAPDWAQKMLCIIVLNRRTHLLSSFRVFVHDGYCLDHGLSVSCTKEMQSGNFQFDIKYPSDIKILSARKLKTLFQKYKHQLQQVFTLASARACVNIYREFLKDTTAADSHENVAWKSEFIFFFSLYRDYSN